MNKILVIFLFLGSQLSAQKAISGTINLDDGNNWEQKIFLAKLDIDHLESLKYGKPVAWANIKADGSFSFDRKHIADKDAVYNLSVRKIEKVIRDTITLGTTFILSNSDMIDFKKGVTPLKDYSNTSLADREWKKLKDFETRLFRSQLAQEQEVAQLKSYAKDSLRILMVKLIGIKQLDDKNLLELDIEKNPEYYLALLTELKESEMPTEQYQFLQKKLAFLTQDVVERKYAWSKLLNFILGFILLGLGVLLVFGKRKQPFLPDLSKQERIVQKLILQGKSNKEIANELFISLSTVKTHITHIYGKLKVSNRGELLRKTQN